MSNEIKELDNLCDWIAHKGGWSSAPVNRQQHVDRMNEVKRRLKKTYKLIEEYDNGRN